MMRNLMKALFCCVLISVAGCGVDGGEPGEAIEPGAISREDVGKVSQEMRRADGCWQIENCEYCVYGEIMCRTCGGGETYCSN